MFSPLDSLVAKRPTRWDINGPTRYKWNSLGGDPRNSFKGPWFGCHMLWHLAHCFLFFFLPIIWEDTWRPQGSRPLFFSCSAIFTFTSGSWLVGYNMATSLGMTCGACPPIPELLDAGNKLIPWLLSVTASHVSSCLQPNTILKWYRTWKVLTKSAPPSQDLNLTAWTQNKRQFPSFKNSHYT